MAYNHAVAQAVAEGDKNFDKSDKSDTIPFDGEFFEDFSDYQNKVFPRKEYWADNYAYINSTYADSMISLGVATLDAYDQYGYPYYSSTRRHTEGDTLTTLPFVFPGALTKPLFLSFFYEAGGKGDLPEGDSTNDPGFPGRDTLIVEFFSHDTVWVPAWKTLDNLNPHRFKQVILQVPDSLAKNGFRFRFRNYVSIPNYPQGTDLGMFGNADQWHIDYIQLKQADDSLDLVNLDDIMVTEPLLSSLTEYTAVPWRHFTLAQSAQGNERRLIPFSFRTYYPDSSGVINSINRIYETYDLNTDEQLNSRIRHNPEPTFEFRHYEDSFPTKLNYNDDYDVGRFEILAYLQTTQENQKRINDTVRRIETYYDYYSYDDGSAELGFGIAGETQDLSRIALRFRAFRRSTNPDTLKAVLIYFCKSINSATDEAFYRISIRKNNGAEPAADTLYTSEDLTPDYNAGLNEFTRIEINRPILIADTFFVVIEQLGGYLNIGYDINDNSLKNLYVYSNHEWINPNNIPTGSLMVRPSFESQSLPNQVKRIEAENDFSVFPNPATEQLNFIVPSSYFQEPFTIQIFNSLGVLQYNGLSRETSIPIGNLTHGMYFIVVSSQESGKRFAAKFIKQ